jgi:hypothetical protein
MMLLMLCTVVAVEPNHRLLARTQGKRQAEQILQFGRWHIDCDYR